MAGERVLLIDESAAVQDMAKCALEEHGYRVTLASNGLAALSHPDIEQFDLVVVMRTSMGSMALRPPGSSRPTAKHTRFRSSCSCRKIRSTRAAVNAPPAHRAGSPSHSPPAQIITKAHESIAEQKLKSLSDQYLEDSAERHMQELAEHKIQQAVERKIQIIVERAIQSIVSIIDQRAKREVDARVTALAAEKEQALVKLTVQEVARSMIEKLAERKVTEAMEQILVSSTEKTVKRAVDTMLPSMIRERLRESIENTLPREIQTRVEKAATDKAQEIGEGIVVVIQQQAQKIVPLVAKERLPEIAERAIAAACETKIPQLVLAEARSGVANELNQRVRPLMDEMHKDLRRRSLNWILVAFITMAIFAFANAFSGPLINWWSSVQKESTTTTNVAPPRASSGPPPRAAATPAP
jgi:hypothetical protein